MCSPPTTTKESDIAETSGIHFPYKNITLKEPNKTKSMAHLRARHYKKLSLIKESSLGEGGTRKNTGEALTSEEEDLGDTPSGEDKSIHI